MPGIQRTQANETQVRLSKIELPKFSGLYEEWHSFFNTFNAMIHSSASLNDIQKFHYLKSVVKGEAAEVTAFIEISAVHYNDAWSRLIDRYDNERVAVQNQIKAIFDLPTLKRENSITLQSILDGILKHTRALESLKRPTAHWGDLLIHIVTSKLDFVTIKEWEASIESQKPPEFNELITFLTKRGKHFVKECSAGGCKICSKKHSTLLHAERELRDSSEATNKQAASPPVEPTQVTNVVCTHAQSKETLESKHVLLSTALVKVKAKNGQFFTGRALLDNGSQSNFITNDFAKKLNMPTFKENIEIRGINQQAVCSTDSVNLKITSRFGTFGTELTYVVLPRITQNIPTIEIDISNIEIPKNIKLADPHFNIPGKIDLLIGADNFWNLMCVGQIKLGKQRPVLQKSLLGWLVSGSTITHKPQGIKQASCHLSVLEELDRDMRAFWEVENYQSVKQYNEEEEYCEKHFKATYRRQLDGRFIVQYPIKEHLLEALGNSKEVALKRFQSLERKFERKSEFKREYAGFMREYLHLGHMKPVAEHDRSKFRVFLPHHAVTKEGDAKSKIRVVFDASSKCSGEKSLNDVLYKGPIIQTELFDLITRFRSHKYVLCADIKKMYRQILIHHEQTALQSIVWRESPDVEIQEYELCTVTYGTKPASFLATRCLLQLAEDEKAKYPRASKVVSRDFYMDDMLTGGDTEADILNLQNKLTELLAKARWNYINGMQTYPHLVKLVHGKPMHYKVTVQGSEVRTTKRTVLSQICRLFDPLGLVGPVITLTKIIMQELWSLGIGWDESVPMHIHKAWDAIKAQLNLLNNLQIPRAVLSSEKHSQIQIHGFCDASEKAYGACIYLREQNLHGKTVISLLCSKSRIAPMKALSLPRLELCGAVLLANLMNRVISSLNMETLPKYFWTDSMIVVAWIRSTPRKWQTFVANRISEIHDKSSPSDWHHVKSGDNPADLISRGATPEQLMQNNSWWKAPWLVDDVESWEPEDEDLNNVIVPEKRKQAIIAMAVKGDTIIDYKRFSSLNKLVRTVAYVLRFACNLKCKIEDRRVGQMSLIEVNEAKAMIIKLVQNEEFEPEIKALRSGHSVPRSSKLIALHPFLDDKGVLRVEGRLKHSACPEETKHPILLPSSHHVTMLVIRHHHEKVFHAGAQTTLNFIREEFWPIFARSRVKKMLRNCVKCRKSHPKANWQIMGELPAARVKITKAFYSSGVDYCGPFYVRDRVRRGVSRLDT
ncbi:uncharacterized protein LOC118646483 [Monomorium pharaonis]|uniref:uncharacterized protein LOC118646483 n=1 Tax=Monomorium pharaonis TaxID=307658 RepID=UPI00174733A4|nr:uncharacterized protein LOC118646483 [Monomorium pharaonis]